MTSFVLLRKTWGEEVWSQNGESRIQVQLEEDGGSGSRHGWMEKTDLWPVIHWER